MYKTLLSAFNSLSSASTSDDFLQKLIRLTLVTRLILALETLLFNISSTISDFTNGAHSFIDSWHLRIWT